MQIPLLKTYIPLNLLSQLLIQIYLFSRHLVVVAGGYLDGKFMLGVVVVEVLGIVMVEVLALVKF